MQFSGICCKVEGRVRATRGRFLSRNIENHISARTKTVKFSSKRTYTRTEIKDVVGGENQTYLPQKNKIILPGCFNKELNPDCPEEIQIGYPDKVMSKAFLLMDQPETRFPVFVKNRYYDKEYNFFWLLSVYWWLMRGQRYREGGR